VNAAAFGHLLQELLAMVAANEASGGGGGGGEQDAAGEGVEGSAGGQGGIRGEMARVVSQPEGLSSCAPKP